MENAMEYKGFIGSVHYSSADEVFHGKIEFITDLVTFEGTNVRELKEALREAVDDYVAFCEEIGKPPVKSLKGVFNVRIRPELHRKAAILAIEKEVSLNQVVSEAISHYVGASTDKRATKKVIFT